MGEIFAVSVTKTKRRKSSLIMRLSQSNSKGIGESAAWAAWTAAPGVCRGFCSELTWALFLYDVVSGEGEESPSLHLK